MGKKIERAAIESALGGMKAAELLDELAKYAPRQSDGFVAGQSVASIVMRRLGVMSEGPINDVDVFVATSQGRRAIAIVEAGQKNKRLLGQLAERVTSSCVGLGANGSYTNMSVSRGSLGYGVRSTAREGMLNEVLYVPTGRVVNSKMLPELVLSGFDMNCVQVGVEARQERLVWTPGFVDFLESWQLEVMNVATPFHTAARYFKKKGDLKAYGDDELNMSVCALPWARQLFSDERAPGRSEHSCVAGRYGQKQHEAALEQEGELSKWFKEIRAMDKAKIWTMEPVFKGKEDVLLKLVDLASPKGKSRQALSAPTSFLMANARDWVKSKLRPQSAALGGKIERLDAMLSEGGCEPEAKRVMLELASLRPDRFSMGELSRQEARMLSEMAGKHGMLAELALELPLREQGAIARRLKSLADEHGEKAYGWIESKAERGGDEALALMRDEGALCAYATKMMLMGAGELAAPLDLKKMAGLAVNAAKSLLQVEFQELVTRNDLEAEGRELRHCVGGYAGAVLSGGSRILRVRGPRSEDRSTAEIKIGYPLLDPVSGSAIVGQEASGYAIAQHRGLANRAAGSAAALAMKMVAASLGLPKESALLWVGKCMARALKDGLVGGSKIASAVKIMEAARGQALALEELGRSGARKLFEDLDDAIASQGGARLARAYADIGQANAEAIELPGLAVRHGM